MTGNEQIDDLTRLVMQALLLTVELVYLVITLVAWRKAADMHAQITTTSGRVLVFLNQLNLIIALVITVVSVVLVLT